MAASVGRRPPPVNARPPAAERTSEDKGRRRRLGEVITALGFADEVRIARALSDQLGLSFLDLGSLPIAEETLAVLPRNVALGHGAVPVTLAHDMLTVALADPTNMLALDDIRLATRPGHVGQRRAPHPRPRHRRRGHRLHPKPFSEAQLRGELAAVLRRRPALVDHRA